MHDLGEESSALLGEHSSVNEVDTAFPLTRLQAPLNVPRWLILTCCVLATLDIAVYISVARLLLSIRDPSDAGTLPVRNQYVGLDELYTSQPALINTSHYEPIINKPRFAAQISSTQRLKVMPEDQHRHLTNIGTLFPPEHHLQVSHDTHTVLQFRAMDFGMERCALVLRLPDVGEFAMSITNNTILDVCALDTQGMIEPRVLSWASRPSCYRHVGALVPRPGGEVQLPDFPCPWGSLHTYEVACASDAPDCNIDVWSDQYAPWGIFMYQFQTI